MTAEEFKALQEKVAYDAKSLFDKQNTELQSQVNSKIEEAVQKAQKGMITVDSMKAAIDEALKEYGTKASALETILKAQGDKINGLVEAQKKPFTDMSMIEDIFKENAPKLRELYGKGTGFIEVSLKNMAVDTKTVTSIGTGVSPMGSIPSSPYAPGISNVPLTVYDILRNQTFVSNYVDSGTTDLSRIAWINETSLIGLATLVLEGAPKPITNRTFQVEFSTAKKVAAAIQITEEFDTDLSYLSSQVQSLLKLDLVRAFDDQIQLDVINNSTPFNLATVGIGGYSLNALRGQIFDATIWDGLTVMGMQARINNFIPNVSLLNPITWGKMQMTKDTVGRYNYPSQELQNALNTVQGNKLFPDYAIVGDLKQFKVLIYKDFVLKMGWINDDFIRNQFTIVAEVRFHDYISTARKPAIIYGDAKWAAEQINGGSASLIGS